jgi:hypothetical protein
MVCVISNLFTTIGDIPFQGGYQIIYRQYAMMYPLIGKMKTTIETLLFIIMMDCQTLSYPLNCITMNWCATNSRRNARGII